jgi:hypothetical protein
MLFWGRKGRKTWEFEKVAEGEFAPRLSHTALLSMATLQLSPQLGFYSGNDFRDFVN